jgi:hypothetical protein
VSTDRGVISGGLGALLKSAVLIVGVPASLLRLWALAPPAPKMTPLGIVASSSGWVHLLLLGVGVLWVRAGVALVRDVVAAVRNVDGSRPGSWSHRWATAIAALFLTLTATSAVATTAIFDPRPAVSVTALRPLQDRPAEGVPSSDLGPKSVRVGECLSAFAARVVGDHGAWTEIAKANLGTRQLDGARFVDANFIRPGWCLTVPLSTSSSTPAPSGSDRSHAQSSITEAALLGVGTLATAAIARRLGNLRALVESGREPGTLYDAPTVELGAIAALIEPFGGGLLVDWIDAALRVASMPYAHDPRAVPPTIRLVRAGPSGVELLLSGVVDAAPHPMQVSDDGRWWILDASVLDDPARLAPGFNRSVPWLVPVGEDADGVYLVAVGPGRRLVIEGEADTAASVVRGLTNALRGLPWATELAVELIGVDPPPAAERSYHLCASSAATLRHLVHSNPPPPRSETAPTWRREPLVIALDGDRHGVDDDLVAEVNAIAGVVTCDGEGSEIVRVDRSGRSTLLPYGIEMTTAVPSSDQLGLIDRLFASASSTTSHRLRPGVGGATTTPGHAPVVEVTLLSGAPTVRGVAPTREHDRIVELLAYLSVRPGPVTISEVGAALFLREPKASVRQRFEHLLAATRAVMPVVEGAPLIAVSSEAITLDDRVTSDWTRVLGEVRRAAALSPADAIDALRDALGAVAEPVILSPKTSYSWMIAEGHAAEMRSVIIDGAHHLATLGFAGDDLEIAEWAISRGLAIDAISEILVRDAMVLRSRRGDVIGVETTYRALEEALGSLASAEPSGETRALRRALGEPTV